MSDNATAPKYTPQAGSLPERVLDWFAKNPEEELSSADIAQKFDVLSSSNVQPMLSAPLGHELLRRERGVYVVGPRFAAWHSARMARAGVVMAQPPRPPRSTPAPLFDPADIAIQPGVKSPRSGENSTDNLAARWRRLYARMEPNSHVEMPRIYAITAKSALTKWRRAYPDQVWTTTLSADTVHINRHA